MMKSHFPIVRLFVLSAFLLGAAESICQVPVVWNPDKWHEIPWKRAPFAMILEGTGDKGRIEKEVVEDLEKCWARWYTTAKVVACSKPELVGSQPIEFNLVENDRIIASHSGRIQLELPAKKRYLTLVVWEPKLNAYEVHALRPTTLADFPEKGSGKGMFFAALTKQACEGDEKEFRWGMTWLDDYMTDTLERVEKTTSRSFYLGEDGKRRNPFLSVVTEDREDAREAERLSSWSKKVLPSRRPHLSLFGAMWGSKAGFSAAFQEALTRKPILKDWDLPLYMELGQLLGFLVFTPNEAYQYASNYKGTALFHYYLRYGNGDWPVEKLKEIYLQVDGYTEKDRLDIYEFIVSALPYDPNFSVRSPYPEGLSPQRFRGGIVDEHGLKAKMDAYFGIERPANP